MAFRWTTDKNEFGAPGMIETDWNRKAGKGTHATLSPSDLHNTLVASGPDFKRAFMDEFPSGNIDLAPTILHILKIKPPQKMDGRVLNEALVDGDLPPASAIQNEMLKVGEGDWQQWLQRVQFGQTIYLEAGNHGSKPAG